MEEDKIIFDDSKRIVHRITLKEYVAAQQSVQPTCARLWRKEVSFQKQGYGWSHTPLTQVR